MKGNKRMASEMIDDHDETNSKPFNPLEAEREGQERKVKWVYYDGSPSRKEKVVSTAPEEVMADVDKVLKGEVGDLQELLFRDPDTFKAGELQSHVDLWNIILDGYKEKENVMKWVGSGVDVETFFKDEYRPSSIRLQNNQSCQTHSSFVTETLLERLRSGAVKVWGKVGERRPPRVVLPMTVADPMTKPRLCIDARYLNEWMKDSPKSSPLESLNVVPNFVYKNSCLSKVDDKSAYLHIRLTENSEEYFGFEWQGWWFVFKTLPFGWKNAPYVYQTVGLGASHFFRSLGIACSLYTDDRLNGELFTCIGEGRWSKPIAERTPGFSSQAAKAALYVVCKVLINLGYFLGLNKCMFEPSTSIVHLGMRIDSTTQSFSVPQEKREEFAKLREEILNGESAGPLQSLQTLKGKCLSYSKAFPLAKMYVREMSAAIDGDVQPRGRLSLPLREEIKFWKFLDNWEGKGWIRDHTVRISLSISQLKWTATIHLTSGDQKHEGPLPSDQPIQAVKDVLENLPSDLRDCEVKIEVNNREVVDEWKKGNLTATMRDEIFELLKKGNILVKMDTTSTVGFTGSDAMLSQSFWNTVQTEFGGQKGHNLDLMSLDVNCQKGNDGRPLRHYTPHITPESAGVDVFTQDLSRCDGDHINAYVYPPFSLIPKLLRYFIAQGAVVTMVVPKFSPVPTWWPIINHLALNKKRLAKRGDQDAILYPDENGCFQKDKSSVELWVFRVDGKLGKPS